MAQKVKLYDPHPGFLGAILPLPKPMKDLADRLNGKVMDLEECLKFIKKEAEKYKNGRADVCEDNKIIFFNYGPHLYRLLRYLPKEE